jgi:nucleotide-binding universal stress UspA family protein
MEEQRMKDIKKIMVPIDFSKGSKKLLKFATYFAEKFDATIYIVSVVEFQSTYSYYEFDPLDTIATLKEDIMDYAQKQMDTFLEENREQLIVPFESSLLTGRVAEELIRYAEDERIDMIIIGTHGYRGLDRMLFGSVASKVIKLAPCPTLTVNTYQQVKEESRK